MPTRNYWQGYTPTVSLEWLAEFNRQKEIEKENRLIGLKHLIETQGRQIAEENIKDYLTESNDNAWVEYNYTQPKAKNKHLHRQNVDKMRHTKEDVEAMTLGGIAPLAVMSAPLWGPSIIAGGDALASSALGKVITKGLTNPYTNALAVSASGAHGLNHAINEGIDGWGDAAITALEVASLGRLAKPMLNEAALAIENYRYPLGRPQVPENYLTIKPQVRTKVEDVEIGTPSLSWLEAQKVKPFRFTGYKESPFQMHLKRARAKGYDVSGIKVIDLTKDSPERTEYINNSGFVGSFEEKLQMLIDRINKGGGAGNPKGTRYILHTNPDNLDARLSHELNHLLHIPDEPIPKSTVYGGWMNIFGDYFKRFNNTDIAARLSQIRDYYGQTGKEPLTEPMLKYAREHYEKDTGIKNRVQEMLWNTGDLKGLAEWGNKHATGLLPFGVIGPYYLKNE